MSTDKTRQIENIIKNIIVIHNDKKYNFLINCNNASNYAKGKYILFLNNDTKVHKDWIISLYNLIENDEKIGMVGSKLIYPNGLLQEAGGIVWNDGDPDNFGKWNKADLPEYNYVKEVDYISGASIMIRKSIWKKIGGFDKRFSPSYFEDTDLAFEIRKLGYKVKYQPKSVVVHYEGISNGKDLKSGIKKYQVKNKELFIEKWKNELKNQNEKFNIFNARDRGYHKNRILVFDNSVPNFDKDAGGRCTYLYLNLFREIGFHVTFIPNNFKLFEPYTSILQQNGIEVLYGKIYKFSLYISIYILKTNNEPLYFKEKRKQNYLEAYKNLKDKFRTNSFLNSFLEEISLISYDYGTQLKEDNNLIHIITNMNNKYIYPSLVSINSVLRNSHKDKTTIVYHILCPKNFRKRYFNKLKSLIKVYPSNLEMIFYNMGNLFNKYKRNRFSEVTFYRLLSPIFIPIEKVIYLDSDVLVYEDLENMYHFPCKNNYVSGFLDFLSDGVDYLGLKSEMYINAGVLLLNLELIRKELKFYEMLNLLKRNIKFKNNDQTIINYVFYPNIGILPSRYGIFNFHSIFDIKYLYLKSIRQNLNFTELIEAFNHPSIMHFVLCNPKVWYSNSLFIKKFTRSGTIKKSSCNKYHDIWFEYAKNTSFFKEIIKYYNLKGN